MSMTIVVALIPARGGSKGLPRKNILPVAGKPLIAWTIDAARGSRQFARVIVSTDDEEIADVSREAGAEVPFLRPPEFASDEASSFDVAAHLLRWLDETDGLRPDLLMLLQPTSPLRTADDIMAALRIQTETGADAVVSVSAAHPHPHYTKELRADGTLVPFIAGSHAGMCRQDLPPAYALNGAIYLNRREALLSTRAFCPPGALACIMPAERSLDIDTAWDMEIADCVLRRRTR